MARDIIISDLTPVGPTAANIVLDDAVVYANKESVEAQVFWRFEDEPSTAPQLLGTVAAGKTLSVPFDLTQGRAIRLFAISRTADGNFSSQNILEGVQSVFDPNLETATPVIGQLTAATNTEVTIWVNNFTTKAKFRKVEVSPNADMSSPDLVETFPATDFPQSILPSSQLVTKTGVSGTVTKYIRVSHSSNGTTFGTASNILTVVFADSGGSGGSGGDGGPCFLGSTGVTIDGVEYRFREIGERKDEFVGKTVRSFDLEGNIVDVVIEDVFCHRVFEILWVYFSDETSVGVTREHPFLNPVGNFYAIGKLSPGACVMKYVDGKLKPVEIVRIHETSFEDRVDVFNFRTSNGHYLADGFAVHNLKDIEL